MRNLLIIGGMCLLAIALGAWLYFGHPNSSSAPMNATSVTSTNPQNVPVKLIDSGTTASSMPSRKNYAIYTSAEFAAFWSKAHDGDGKPVPPIDFSKDYVIGVFAGTVPSNGYSIQVANVTDSADTRSVTVVIDEPGANCTIVEEPTSPYEFVVVPFSDAQTLSHTDEHVKQTCE